MATPASWVWPLVVILTIDVVLLRTFNILSKRPEEVPSQSKKQTGIILSSLWHQPEEGGQKDADDTQPPTEHYCPEQIARQKMALCLGRWNRVESFICMTSDGSRLLVQRRFPDWKAKGMLDVDERLTVFEGRDRVLVLYPCVILFFGSRRLVSSTGSLCSFFWTGVCFLVVFVVFLAQNVLITVTRGAPAPAPLWSV
jgi:hypothetical protein